MRKDFKAWMNKIAAPLNIIANFITQNHVQKCMSAIKIAFQFLRMLKELPNSKFSRPPQNDGHFAKLGGD